MRPSAHTPWRARSVQCALSRQLTITQHVCGAPRLIDPPKNLVPNFRGHAATNQLKQMDNDCRERFIKIKPGHYPLPHVKHPPEPLLSSSLDDTADPNVRVHVGLRSASRQCSTVTR